MREADLKKESRKPRWKRCVICGVLLKGQTREVRVAEGKWACFNCASQGMPPPQVEQGDFFNEDFAPEDFW